MNKPSQTRANTQIQRTGQLPERKEWEGAEGEKGKGDHLYSNEWKLNFW